MIEPTLPELFRVLTILEKRDFLSFSRTVMQLRNPEERKAPLSFLPQMQAYLYEWLMHLGIFNAAQCERIVACWSPVLFVTSYDAAVPGNPNPHLLSISNKRWVQVATAKKVYDAEEDAWLDAMPQRCVTHFICDMNELFAVKQEWLKKLGGKDAGHQHTAEPAAATEEPARGHPGAAGR